MEDVSSAIRPLKCFPYSIGERLVEYPVKFGRFSRLVCGDQAGNFENRCFLAAIPQLAAQEDTKIDV